MHLHPTGTAALGFASVSIDGVTPVALSGLAAGNPDGPVWFNLTTLLFQNFVSTPFVESYNPSTHATATWDANAASSLAAGTGIWASGLKSSPSIVRSNVPGLLGPLSGAMLGDVSNHGELVVITSYPAMHGLTVYDAAGGTLLALPAVNVVPMSGTSILRLRDHLLVYVDASAGWTMKAVTGGAFRYAPRTGTPVNWTVPVQTASGTIYVLEASDILTLRQADKGQGWQLMPTGALTFNPDVIELSPGVLRIGWSINAGESPTALRMIDLTLATGATVNWSSSGGTLTSSLGPTLTLTTLPVGKVQGSTGGDGLTALPLQHPVTDASTGDRITKPWAMALTQFNTGLAGNTKAIASLPPVTAPPAEFGVVVANSVPVAATIAHDTLTLTSTDNTVAMTANPATKTIDLSASGSGSDHYDAPLSDGDLVAADLIYAAGECIIVQVPL